MLYRKSINIAKVIAPAHRYTAICDGYVSEEGFLYATNGRMAVRHRVKLEGGDKPGPVSAKAIKAGRGVMTLADRHVAFVDGFTMPRDNARGEFPDVDAVMRKSGDELVKVRLNAAYLKAMLEALGAKTTGDPDNADQIVLEIKSSKDAVMVRLHDNEGEYLEADGAIMPIYGEDD